jgi:hypothetical protein
MQSLEVSKCSSVTRATEVRVKKTEIQRQKTVERHVNPDGTSVERERILEKEVSHEEVKRMEWTRSHTLARRNIVEEQTAKLDASVTPAQIRLAQARIEKHLRIGTKDPDVVDAFGIFTGQTARDYVVAIPLIEAWITRLVADWHSVCLVPHLKSAKLPFTRKTMGILARTRLDAFVNNGGDCAWPNLLTKMTFQLLDLYGLMSCGDADDRAGLWQPDPEDRSNPQQAQDTPETMSDAKLWDQYSTQDRMGRLSGYATPRTALMGGMAFQDFYSSLPLSYVTEHHARVMSQDDLQRFLGFFQALDAGDPQQLLQMVMSEYVDKMVLRGMMPISAVKIKDIRPAEHYTLYETPAHRIKAVFDPTALQDPDGRKPLMKHYGKVDSWFTVSAEILGSGHHSLFMDPILLQVLAAAYPSASFFWQHAKLTYPRVMMQRLLTPQRGEWVHQVGHDRVPHAILKRPEFRHYSAILSRPDPEVAEINKAFEEYVSLKDDLRLKPGESKTNTGEWLQRYTSNTARRTELKKKLQTYEQTHPGAVA